MINFNFYHIKLNQIILASYYNGALRYHGMLGPDGSLFGQADGTSRYYFLKDHPSVDGHVLGSVRTTVDFSNTALGYDPDFHRGRLYPFEFRRGGMPGRSSSSSTPDDDYPDFIGTGHTLSAHWRKRDSELDLDYMLARNYDPLIGRFMQVDPLAIDYPAITPYGYVLNNPLGLVDPTGMAATDPPFGSGWLNSLVKQLEGYYMGVNTFNDRNYVNTMQSGIGNDLGNAAYFGGNMVVDATATTADFVSDGSTWTVADATSTVAKGADAVTFDGSKGSFNNQLVKTGINYATGRVANNITGSFIKVGSSGRFFNPSNGRFVTNQFGYGVSTARDATKVSVPLLLPSVNKN